MRQEFDRKTRRQAYDLAGGVCAMCRLPIQGRADYDHKLPAALGGDNSLENCQVLCAKCHRLKTGKEDVPRIRKADRQRDKATGAKKRKGRPMPGSRDSKIKRKVDGTVEWR